MLHHSQEINMNDIVMFMLLKIIKHNKNLNSLLRIGLSYKRIAEFTEQTAKENLIIINQDGVSLTVKGEELYKQLEVLNKKTNKQEWIEKEKKSEIPKLDSDFIFLPNPSEVDF